ncbi:MAG TPA: LysR family transcriptional regulator [Methylibium sp.]|nr:LysR family transcriptional regulator [Methylibium sp.]
MELRQMREFLALAEERNFRRAAERLHMAQPPLTRQIRALEEEMGAPLFVRTPKGVELTEAGLALLDEVPNLLRLAERAKERTQLTGKGLIGKLEVGVFGSGVLDVIPRLLARFHQARPEVEIELHHLTKVQQIEALRERRIMVGFNRLFPPQPDLAIETVLRERLMVAMYKSNPLCRKREITVRDIDNAPLIVYPASPLPGLAQQVANAFHREGMRMNVVQSVEDVLTSIALVAGGFGISVATESTASLQLPGVVYRPLNCRYLKDIELACIHRRDDPSPILATFLDVVREFAKERQQR